MAEIYVILSKITELPSAAILKPILMKKNKLIYVKSLFYSQTWWS